jgi:hypothetical protein
MPYVQTSKEEFVVHRFWSCCQSQQLWAYTNQLLHLLAGASSMQHWMVLNWRQTLFSDKASHYFKSVKKL